MTPEPLPESAGGADRPTSPAFWIAVAALTAANLVPVWGFTYYPSQDGPAHLENAWMLRHWFEGGREFGQYYALVLEPLPNWMSHFVLALLMVVCPPLVAEKVLLSGYVLVFTGSLLYLLGGVGRRNRLLVLLAMPFVHHALLMKGFWNFSLGVPALLVLLGYWWRRCDRSDDAQTVVVVNLLLAATYFCHLVAAVVGLGSLLVLWSIRGRLRPGAIGRATLGLLPGAALPIWYVASRGLGGSPFTLDFRPARLVRLDLLVSHDPRSVWVAAGLAGVIALLAMRTVVRRWRRPRELRDGFLLVAGGLMLLSCVVPGDLGGGSLLDLRLALFPAFLILPWLAADLGRRGRIAVGAAAVVLTIAQLTFVLVPFPRLQSALADYASGAEHVKRNQTLLPVNLIDHGAIEGSRVSALLHAAGYYCVRSGAINLNNYEASSGHFPLRYHPDRDPLALLGDPEGGLGLVAPDRYPVPVDFVLLRCPRAIVPGLPAAFERYPPTRRIVRRYRLVHSRGDVWLFRRRGTRWPPPVKQER